MTEELNDGKLGKGGRQTGEQAGKRDENWHWAGANGLEQLNWESLGRVKGRNRNRKFLQKKRVETDVRRKVEKKSLRMLLPRTCAIHRIFFPTVYCCYQFRCLF